MARRVSRSRSGSLTSDRSTNDCRKFATVSRSNSVPLSQSIRTKGLISSRLETSQQASLATRCGHSIQLYKIDAVIKHALHQHSLSRSILFLSVIRKGRGFALSIQPMPGQRTRTPFFREARTKRCSAAQENGGLKGPSAVRRIRSRKIRISSIKRPTERYLNASSSGRSSPWTTVFCCSTRGRAVAEIPLLSSLTGSAVRGSRGSIRFLG